MFNSGSRSYPNRDLHIPIANQAMSAPDATGRDSDNVPRLAYKPVVVAVPVFRSQDLELHRATRRHAPSSKRRRSPQVLIGGAKERGRKGQTQWTVSVSDLLMAAIIATDTIAR